MDLVALTEEIVKSLVEDPDTVSVKEFESENEEELLDVEEKLPMPSVL